MSFVAGFAVMTLQPTAPLAVPVGVGLGLAAFSVLAALLHRVGYGTVRIEVGPDGLRAGSRWGGTRHLAAPLTRRLELYRGTSEGSRPELVLVMTSPDGTRLELGTGDLDGVGDLLERFPPGARMTHYGVRPRLDGADFRALVLTLAS